MKKNSLLIFIVLIILTSCKSSRYYFVDIKQKYGVDFREGKWLLNELDCPKNSKVELTSETIEFFKKQTKERFFYIKDVSGLLISNSTPLNPNKTKLKELKQGTGYDYFINIVLKKNKSDLNTIGLYETKYPTNNKNESEVYLEIYDLNLLHIIYSSHVIGIDNEDTPSAFGDERSDRLINNISFHKSSNKLMKGCLKKILKDLSKKSIKN